MASRCCWPKHEDTSLSLRLHRDGEVNGHLIAVEVRVEGATHERVQADRLALDQLRLKRLNTEAVQRGCGFSSTGCS